ncbi:hypothetical protein [Roseateles sp.]|jgi:hypothetical protein|uniref:hypothetical protein n=1 Tax=Roseateles sp. TaxID=1971397 RepID=UPI00391D0BEA
MRQRSPTPRCDQEGFPVAALLDLGASEPVNVHGGAAERAAEIASFCLQAWLRAASEPVLPDALDDAFQGIHARRMEIAGELSRLIEELEQQRVSDSARAMPKH